LIVERRLQIPDRENKQFSSFFPLEVKLEGIGPNKEMPSTLTAIVEGRDWAKRRKGQYFPHNERSYCYEFCLREEQFWVDGKKKTFPPGHLKRISVHRGTFTEPGFRYADTRMQEWCPAEDPPQFRHQKKAKNYNHKISQAYVVMEDIELQLRGERSFRNMKLKEKDEIDYFLRAIAKIFYFEYETHLYVPLYNRRR
jgi:hypothetical protein